jgi:hypothetical protein
MFLSIASVSPPSRPFLHTPRTLIDTTGGAYIRPPWAFRDDTLLSAHFVLPI